MSASQLNPSLIKKVLEAALLAAREPMTPLVLKKLFEEDVSTDTVRKLLDELREDWSENRKHPRRGGE